MKVDLFKDRDSFDSGFALGYITSMAAVLLIGAVVLLARRYGF